MTNNKPDAQPSPINASEGVNSAAYVMIYTTLPSAAQAQKLGESLVRERLAGCVNILPAMSSMYIWQGKLETAQEVVLLAKLPRIAADQAIQAIKAAHPYEVPAIVVLPIIDGYEPYLKWLSDGVTRAERAGDQP